MRQNYKLKIAYDGSRYYGWEHQPDQELTIQGKLENVFSKMVDEEVEIIGAGRTDAGVHAKGMIANVFLDTDMTPDEIRDYANRYLPDDIALMDVKVAAERFHSRYNAVGKTYVYTCYYNKIKTIFDRKFVYTLDRMPDVEKMQKAASYLIGQHDFASFCSNSRMKKSTVRIVDNIEINKRGSYISFTYHGTGFLQHMVRILTGTLLEVGFGVREADSMPELIEAKDRKLAGYTAPAKGLCLMKVDYN